MSNAKKRLFSLTMLLTLLAAINSKASAGNACMTANASSKSACATVPLASVTQDAAGKEFTPAPDGKARLYIVRESIGVRHQIVEIRLNGQRAADIAPYTYVALDIVPGKYRLGASAANNAELDIDVEAGKLYYVEADLSLMLIAVSANLQLLDEKEGQEAVLQTERALSHADTE